MKTLLLVTLFLLIALNISAKEEKKLYKWTDKQGNTYYSDQPQEGAEEIEMKTVPAIKMTQPNYNFPETQSNSNLTRDLNSYTELTFISPTKDGVVRNNGNRIDLIASVSPTLQNEHSIRFFIDGSLVSAEAGSTTATATEIEIGPHSANFIIVDAQGKVIQSSETINFQLLNRINPNIKKQQQQSQNKPK